MNKQALVAGVIAMMLAVCAIALIHDSDAEGASVEDSTEDVASISNESGTTSYDSLVAAFNAIKSGDTIKLLRDVEDTSGGQFTIQEGWAVTIDLGSKTLKINTSETTRPIQNHGNLTITGDGTIDTSAGSSYGIIENFGTLTITNGSFIGKYTQDGTLVKTQPGSMTTINGGFFEGSPGAVLNFGDTTINGGKFESDCCSSCDKAWAYVIRNNGEGTLTINDAEVIGTQGAVSSSNGFTEINGGTFTTRHCPNDASHDDSAFYALYVAGEYDKTSCVVNGGTFTAYNRAAVQVGNSNDGGIQAAATIRIFEGNFAISESSTANVISCDEETSSVPDAQVYGGHFDRTLIDGVIAPGYTQGTDGNVTFTGEAVASIGDLDFTTLEYAIDAAGTGDTIVLKKNITLTQTMIFEKDVTWVLNLNGFDIIGNSGPVLQINAGNVTIEDTTASMSMDESNWTVTYSGGKIATAVGNNSDAVLIAGDGTVVTMRSGMIDSTGDCGVYVNGNTEFNNNTPHNSSFTLDGGYVHAQEYGIGVQGNGAVVNVKSGFVVTVNNLAVGGNGNNTESVGSMGGTTLNITGGTIVSNITSKGYISCGVYQPQSGKLSISGGKIVSTNGLGILMRGGELDMTGGEIIAMGDSEGKVGDSKILTSGAGIYVDIDSGYYDYKNIKVSISGGTIESKVGSIKFLNTAGTEKATDYISVTGGTHSSDVSEFVSEGYGSVKFGDVYRVSEVFTVTFPERVDAISKITITQGSDSWEVTGNSIALPDGTYVVKYECVQGVSAPDYALSIVGAAITVESYGFEIANVVGPFGGSAAGSMTLEVEVTAPTDAAIVYQWSNAEGLISGATGNTYEVTVDGEYGVKVTVTYKGAVQVFDLGPVEVTVTDVTETVVDIPAMVTGETATVDDTVVQQKIEDVKDEANPVVNITATEATSVKVSAGIIGAAAGADVTIRMTSENGTVVVNADVAASIMADHPDATDITLSIKESTAASVSADYTTVDITITADGANVSTFGGHELIINLGKIPDNLKDRESEIAVLWFDNGDLHIMDTEIVNREVIFTTPHLTTYVIGTRDMATDTEPGPSPGGDDEPDVPDYPVVVPDDPYVPPVVVIEPSSGSGDDATKVAAVAAAAVVAAILAAFIIMEARKR